MLDIRFGNPNYYQNIYKGNNARNIEIEASEMKMKKLMAEQEHHLKKEKSGTNAVNRGQEYADYVMGSVGKVTDNISQDWRKSRASAAT